MAEWDSYLENRENRRREQKEHFELTNKPFRRGWKSWFFALLAALLLVLGCISYLLFQSFSKVILATHQNQLANITESAAISLQIYLEGFQKDCESLVDLSQFKEAEIACEEGDYQPMNDFLAESRAARTDDIVYMSYFSYFRGYCAEAGETRVYSLAKILGTDENFQKITIMKDSEGEFYFCLGAQTHYGAWLNMYVPARKVYDTISASIQMGSNGYIMYKDSNGIILMHPVDAQIGIDVLADRKKQHPDFDFSELEVLIEHQMEELTGVEVYNSYWWAEENPSKVKKVSAYQPLPLGSDFISVSAVIDYAEVAGEIQQRAFQMYSVILLMVLIFAILILSLWRSLRRQNLTAQENTKLIEINDELEKQRKEEELLAHKQRLELVGTMTSGIAHEFNNLLTPIMGYSAILLSGMKPEDEDYEDIQAIYDSAEKAKEIISRLNQFNGKNAEMMMSPIHVADALEKSLVLTDAAKRRFIRLVSHLEKEDDICMGNLTQIQQMVMNLCNNALQAMGDQEGTLTVSSEVVVGAEMKNPFFVGKEHKRFYRITVEDTGCGMDQETLSQIFVPFFTTKRPGEGTGLGMPVVLRMVEAHEGLICVASEPGEGTSFRIYLPMLEKTDQEREES